MNAYCCASKICLRLLDLFDRLQNQKEMYVLRTILFRNIGGSFNHSNHSEINSNNHNSIMHYCNHCTQRKGASVLILSKSQAQPQSDETSRCEHRNATRQIRIPYWTIGPSRIYHQLFFSCSKKPHSAQPTRLDNHRPLRLRAGEVPRARSNGHS